MNAWTPKRRSRGAWIGRTLADMADIRGPLDALAFLLCGACVAAIGWMVTHPLEFYAAVMGVFS